MVNQASVTRRGAKRRNGPTKQEGDTDEPPGKNSSGDGLTCIVRDGEDA